MVSKPCPCSGCNSGTHSNGMVCRYCTGRGYTMAGDWPQPCWDGYSSSHMPPNPNPPKTRARPSGEPTLSDELEKWLPNRNKVSRWSDSHGQDWSDSLSESGAWLVWAATELDALEDGTSEITLAVEDLKNLTLAFSNFRGMANEQLKLLQQAVRSTDAMFHNLGWTASD